MDLYITVGSDQAAKENKKATVIVDLRSLWGAIAGRFTHIHLDLLLSIPVVLEDEDSTVDNPMITIQRSKDIAVCEIKDYKVTFVVNYSAMDDIERTPFGVAYLRGYQQTENSE